MRRTSLVGIFALVACADSTSPSDAASLAALTAEASVAVTEPVVSDLFRMAAYVAGGLEREDRGCNWEFDLATTGYAPVECGLPMDRLTVYRISLPDLPHQGAVVPLDLPLAASGVLRFPIPTCDGGFDLASLERMALLVACPDRPGDGAAWQVTLAAGGGFSSITARRTQLGDPSPRTRYEVTLLPPGRGEVTLRHDDLTGVERSESRMIVSIGAVRLELTGFAGATGPDYEAARNGTPLGRIYWAGRTGFATVGPAGEPLSESDDRLLRDARLLLAALARMAGGTAFFLDQLGG